MDTSSPPNVDPLAEEFRTLHSEVVERVDDARARYPLPNVEAEASRDNLLAYLALREHDLLSLQFALAERGLSSLGRLESHVLDALERVLAHLGGGGSLTSAHTPSRAEARAVLEERARTLLGRPRPGRTTRIMVTLDTTALGDPGLLEQLLLAGMDIARINCAHESPDDWIALVRSIREAETRLERTGREIGRSCHILMDLAGPKIRTGSIATEAGSLKLPCPKELPEGEEGAVGVEGLLDLQAPESEWFSTPRDGAHFVIAVNSAGGLQGLEPGDPIPFEDSRAKSRQFRVVQRISPTCVRVSLNRTSRVSDGTELLPPKGGMLVVRGVGRRPIPITVEAGDRLRLYRDAATNGHAARYGVPAGISCSEPEVLRAVESGHRVYVDDGKIAGIARECEPEYVELEIVAPAAGAARVREEKGLNFPDTPIDLPALQPADRENLPLILEHATAVGLSFAHSPEDIRDLHQALADAGHPEFGVIAKIETAEAIHSLGRILLAGLELPRFGVMIARGDLAVEIGFENLALVQEDLLCLCEAAHVPVIWATQVLETLAKTGLPVRPEITDAAMGQRAECVMLNKGPHIVKAVQVLAELMESEERHHVKKHQVFREFTAQRGVL